MRRRGDPISSTTTSASGGGGGGSSSAAVAPAGAPQGPDLDPRLPNHWIDAARHITINIGVQACRSSRRGGEEAGRR